LFCLIRHPTIIAPIATHRQALLTERLRCCDAAGRLFSGYGLSAGDAAVMANVGSRFRSLVEQITASDLGQ